ncbi:hypothetical protein LTR50_005035 [Elasticomyces elasticus]|nr:hypothetical protein LTR50_005035 [Elasticomyces elasticus]
MSFLLKYQVTTAPISYTTPPFPSLYWPFPISGAQIEYLYNAHDMWRFTLLWTLIIVVATHLVAAGYAMITQWRSWKVIWIVPVIYGLVGGVEALIAGSVVGGL